MTIAEKIQRIISEKNSLITTLKTKGFTIPDDTKLGDLTDIVETTDIGSVTPSAGKKVVNFYDYDGTLLHSYTRGEVLELSELPSLPDRSSEGLTCQGWNYVLNGYIKDDSTAVSGIVDDLNANAKSFAIDVGANYITTDGATYINITMADKYRSKMPLMFTGDVTIDWGDGVIESVNHESATTITHDYAIAQSYPAKYTIKLTVNSGTLTLGGGSDDYNICGSTTQSTSNPASAYSSRIDSVFIGSNVTSIGTNAFYNCSSLASVTIPSSVTSISENAFYNCYSLASISIPNSVTSIGNSAFYNCYSLSLISIPSSVTSIGTNTFYYCSSLASISIPNGITSISSYTFSDCYSLASITIPSSVTSIGDYAFQYCYSFTSITIPGSVTSIGNNAFQYCRAIASITIPSSVTSIGDYAFQYCPALASITIPSSVKSIGNNAFQYCYSITSITIPNGVTSIGNNAFYSCSSLTSITIPSSVTSIGDYAFYDCNSLASITIPSSVTSIGDYAFQYCRSIASITIPSSVTSIGDYAFQYCYSITSVTIPNSITSISKGAFAYCSALASVTISNGVTSIGNNAFYNCYSITSISIPNSVTSIGSTAFRNCYSLASVTIPNGVTSIASNTFNGCYSIIKYDFSTYAAVPTLANTSAFTGIANDAKIVVPDSLYDTWIAADKWSTYKSKIVKISEYTEPQYVPPTIITYTNGSTKEINVGDDGILTWEMTKGDGNEIAENTTIQSVEIGSDVTSIGEYAFFNCTGLKSVTIPSSVTSIGKYAFDDCTNLTSVTISEGVTSIGFATFEDCSNLTSVTIPSSVTSIDDRAFRNCYGLTSVTIPNSVASIGANAFYYCESLTSITIPEGVTSLGEYVFRYCSSLTSITIPSSATSIGYSAFQYCSSLNDITFDKTVNEVSSMTSYPWELATNTIITCTDGQITVNVEKYNSKFDYEIVNGYAVLKGLNSEAISDGNLESENEYAEGLIIPQGVSDDGIAYTVQEIACKKDQDNLPVHWSKLPSIEIPNNIRKIDEFSFYYCTSLNAVNIPASIEYIGSEAFAYCPSTCIITTAFDMQTFILMERYPWGITEGATVVCTDGTFTVGNEPEPEVEEVENIFAYTVSEINGIQQATLCGLANSVNSNTYDQPIIVPASVDGYEVYNIVGNSSAGGCGGCANTSWEKVPSIEIQYGVEEIGEKAFYWCGSLSSLIIPNSVNVIGNYAFSSAGLQSLVIPSSVYMIGDNTFEHCYELTSLVINAGNSAITIGTNAFYYCQSLTNISLPANTSSIGSNAFYGCPRSCQITIDKNSNSITHLLYNAGFKTGTQIQCKDTTITL